MTNFTAEGTTDMTSCIDPELEMKTSKDFFSQ